MANFVNYTYVYFYVKDATGSSSLSSYTLPNAPLTFYPDFTTSPVLTSTDNISNKIIRWDFGDGSFSNSLTAVHNYKWPGEYSVRLSIYDKQGNSFDSSYRPLIKIYDYVRDQLQFKDFDKLIYDVPAGRLNEPIIIQRQNSWQSYNALSATGYTVNLYASGANAQYQNIDNFFNDKWSHLRKLSRFYTIAKIGNNYEYRPVDKVTTSNEEIYVRLYNKKFVLCNKDDSGAVLAGTKGDATIFYVDDVVRNYSSLNPPVFLFATFDSSKFQDEYSIRNDTFEYTDYPPYGFQNLKPAVFPIVKVRPNPAYKLSITTTGIDGEGSLSSTRFDIPEISWQNTEIPFVIKLKDELNFTTKTYPPLYSSTIDPSLNLTAYDLKIGVVALSGTKYIDVPSFNFYEDFTSEVPRNIGAFYKGYFISPDVTYNCKLTAQMYLTDPVTYAKDTLIGWIAVPQFDRLIRFFNQQIYSNCPGYLTVTVSSSRFYFNSFDNRNVYAIQVAPSGSSPGTDYNTWFADGTRNTIFKFDIQGNKLKEIDLSSAPTLSSDGKIVDINYLSPVLQSAGPGSITLDGSNDIWVALFDSVSCIKIDGNSGIIKRIAYPPFANYVYSLSGDYNISSLSGFAGENLLLPSSVDTDLENNLWVSYTHPASNILVKYNTDGQYLFSVPMPWMHSPVELLVDRNRFVWLSTYNLSTSGTSNLTARNDFLYKFTSDGDLVPGYPIDGFNLIGNIAVDGGQNIWVSHDRDTVTKIDGITNARTDYIAGSGNNTNYIQSFGGIAIDSSAYLWVINNFNNRMYFVDTTKPPPALLDENLYIDIAFPAEDPAFPLSSFEEKQFQAYGDWLGSRWINKYALAQTPARTLTGESAFFNIYPLSGVYNIQKVNENFDAEAFYKSLIFTENLEDKKVLFEDFLGTIVGDRNAMPYELGKTVYEKIANYVNNTTDIDSSNLDQLLSFCDELSIQFEQYNYPFPPQLLRLVNILSIKQKKLWGDQNRYEILFSNNNLPDSTELSTLTSVVSVGYPVVAKELFSNIYSVVNKNVIEGYNSGDVLPLSTYNYNWGWGLVVPTSLTGIRVSDYYRFYEYKPVYDNKFYNNVIDWDNPLNTLNFYNSSFNDWSKNNGTMQNMLSYELTKGLRLFLSGSNIVYNN